MTCLLVRRFHVLLAAFAVTVSMGYRTFAQDVETAPAKGAYRSDIDDLLTIQKVSLLPFTDNLQGIYSRPLETHFISKLEGMHRWDFVPSNPSGPILSPEELEAAPDKAVQVSQGMGADAFFAARISKGPNGVTIHLSLFLTKDGKLLSQAILKDYKQFNINDLKEQTQRLLNEIVTRLPYAGRVLSREANRVTVNLGNKDGIQKNQLLSVIQIIQAHRHPKFNFLVRTEKEIFGRIKILKVEDTLSFGVVVSEKERGAIQKNSKIGPIDFVTYSGDSLSLTPSPEETLTSRDDGDIAFGKNAKAWTPQNPATFGQVGARLGISQIREATDLAGVGPQSGQSNFSPSVILDGELWLTQEWTFHARLKQGIASVENPRAGSAPKTLSQSFAYYEGSVGYRLRFGPYNWSPYAEPFLGYLNSKLYSDSATPEVFLTQQYSGMKLGVHGAAPIGQGDFGVGGEFSMVFSPKLKEAPVTSGGSAKNQVVQFGILGYKKMGERLKMQLNLDFEMYSSNFSGPGGRAEAASSSSQKFTTLSGGLYYMF